MSALVQFLKDNWLIIVENKWLFISISIILLGLGYTFGRFVFNKKILDLEHKISDLEHSLTGLSETENQNKTLSEENKNLLDETTKLREQLAACTKESKILVAKAMSKQGESKYNVAESFATSDK